jgi:hypothetical protein
MLTHERHFTIGQLCVIWGGPNPNPRKPNGKQPPHPLYHTVRRWFQQEKDVVDASNGKRNKHPLIPESVAQRVYERRMLGRVA